MNIHRLEEDGGGGDKFEGPKPLHFKRLVRFLREGSEPSSSPGTCRLGSSVLWIRLLPCLSWPLLSPPTAAALI